LQFYRAGLRVGLLDVDVRAIETTRARRHDLHRIAQTAADLPALVSPYYRFIVLLVLVRGIYRVCAMVRRDELLRPFDHVQLLRSQSDAVQAT